MTCNVFKTLMFYFYFIESVFHIYCLCNGVMICSSNPSLRSSGLAVLLSLLEICNIAIVWEFPPFCLHFRGSNKNGKLSIEIVGQLNSTHRICFEGYPSNCIWYIPDPDKIMTPSQYANGSSANIDVDLESQFNSV